MKFFNCPFDSIPKNQLPKGYQSFSCLDADPDAELQYLVGFMVGERFFLSAKFLIIKDAASFVEARCSGVHGTVEEIHV